MPTSARSRRSPVTRPPRAARRPWWLVLERCSSRGTRPWSVSRSRIPGTHTVGAGAAGRADVVALYEAKGLIKASNVPLRQQIGIVASDFRSGQDRADPLVLQ